MKKLIYSILLIICFIHNSHAKEIDKKKVDVVKTNKDQYKKPNPEFLKQKLTKEQYTCTQEEGTEKPFHNAYWDNKKDGIYVDVVSGEPLFSSLNKYDSGSGWPSFDRPIDEAVLNTKSDNKYGMSRVEVRSSKADSHLGHVFDDGPVTTGKRFCINSASLNFIPVEKLKEKGYGPYLFQFAEKMNWEIATLAGGCFWGMEELIKSWPGVIETQVGYTGGSVSKASYEQVKTGKTNHAESVRVLFDPKKTSYENILFEFFKIHDPTMKNQQGNDVGTQYRSAIFYQSDKQKSAANKVIEKVNKSGFWKKPIVTEVVKASDFWPAEEYHQKYLEHHPGGYTCHFTRKVDFQK